MNHSMAFQSQCMIKFCSSTPTISVYLAEQPACDEAAANLLLRKKNPYLMSWPKRFKSSHVFGMFCWRRFLWGSSQVTGFSFYSREYVMYFFIDCSLCYPNRFFYSLYFLLQRRLLTTAFYMPSIQCDSSTCYAIGPCFSAELNKHSAILLFAWLWNHILPLDISAFSVTHLFHNCSSSSQKASHFVV